MNIPITDREFDFLLTVRKRQSSGDPVIPYQPVAASIRSLIDRGYVREVELRDMFGKTGETGLRITEAGEIVLTLLRERRDGVEKLKEDPPRIGKTKSQPTATG